MNHSAQSTQTKSRRPESINKSSTGPRIPVDRPTLASRSNASTSTIPNRFSNASNSSATSTGSSPSVAVKKQRVVGPTSNNAKATQQSSNVLKTTERKTPVQATRMPNIPTQAPNNRLSNASVASSTSSVKSTGSSPSVAVKKQRLYGPTLNNVKTTKQSSNVLKTNVRKTPTQATRMPNIPTETPKNRLSNTSVASSTSTAATAKKQKSAVPAWDTKGQIKELQAQNAEIDEQVMEAEKEKNQKQLDVEASDAKLKEAEKTVAELEALIKETLENNAQEIQSLEKGFDVKNKELEEQNESKRSLIEAMRNEAKELNQVYLDTLKAIESEELKNATLAKMESDVEAAYEEAETLLFNKKMEAQEKREALEESELEIFDLAKEMQEKERRIESLEKTLFEMEVQRRKDHEKLQELKGNIRVFCRVRPPMNPKEDSTVDIRYFGEENESIELSEQVTSARGKVSNKSYTFTFDRIFSPECTQKECYEEISQLVQSALDGFNVCIFAYGQTGSGKTFTMQGPAHPDEESWGMIPRAVQQIYEVAQKLKEYGWEYTMEGQFLEIYNDTIHDLLGKPSTYGKVKHEIYHTEQGTTVTNMSTVVLDSPTKLKSMLKRAIQNRATEATNINERSSRSHSVFTLRLTGYNKDTQERTHGRLNLIDLAGSERLNSSGSTGDRLTETISINKSLSCLQSVIHALAENKKGGYIRYRDSKLTYLLQNSLGRNSKTLMFLNISPLKQHYNESICSLKFAREANSCHVDIKKY